MNLSRSTIVFRFSLLATALILSLAACATASYPYISGGEPELEAGSIVFTGVDGNLYVASAASDEIVQVAGDASETLRYSAYTWAGEEVVFVAQEVTAEGRIASSISAVSPHRRGPGGRSRLLFEQRGLAPFFLNPTKDGRRVGYLGGQDGVGSFVMGSVNVETGERLIHGQGQPFYAAWSPDGSALITHIGAPVSTRGSELGIQQVADLTPFDPTALVPPDSDITEEVLALGTGSFQTPEYSPDGSRIAVVLESAESAGIHLLDSQGVDQGRLVALQGVSGSLSWNPNGTRLAYMDGFPTRFGALVGRLYIARLGANQPRLVSEAAIAHFWSPDGAKLLYFEPFVPPNSNQLGYRLGVYYLGEDQSRILATMRPSPVFASQIIPFVDQYERGYTIWSPDSRLVVVNTRASNGEEIIHLIDTESFAAANTFRIGYTPVQDRDSVALGIAVAEGVRHRPLTAGSLPFFNTVE